MQDLVADSRLGYPSDFRRESLQVLLLLLESGRRDEHGEVTSLNTKLLDLGIEPF
jgi:hypothetical protein